MIVESLANLVKAKAGHPSFSSLWSTISLTVLCMQMLQLWSEKYPGPQRPGYTRKCYSSEEKGVLAIGSQEMPAALFWWGMVSLQECSSSTLLGESPYFSAPRY